MSNWRDLVLVPASFRGVTFKVEGEELETGIRGTTHQYPFRKGPGYREETGEESGVYSIDAFVLGDDYLDQKKALLSELMKGGPGQLVHPFYSTILVSVGKIRVRETASDGGMAKLTIEFHHTTTSVQPTTEIDGTAAVGVSAGAAISSAGSVFQAAFVKVSTIHDSVIGVITKTTNTINGLISKVSLATQDMAQMVSLTEGLANSAENLATQPALLVVAVTGMFDSLRKYVANAENVSDPLALFAGVYNQDPGARPPAVTPNRVIEQQNFDAIHLLMQRCAVAQAAQILTTISFASYDEAIAARERVTDMLDDQANIAADDAYPALSQLAADLVSAVPGTAGDLPRLVKYTPRVTLPSLVVAHRLYGGKFGTLVTLENAEADLVARNGVGNPGFVLGGVELEILSNGE